MDRPEITVRAGTGVFTGRPPFVWLGGAFSNTGLDQATLVCLPVTGVPAPVTNVDSLPRQCLFPAQSTPLASVTHVSSTFRYPRVVKSILGVDANTGDGTSVSVDVAHTMGREEPYVRDVNLSRVGTTSEGRAIYGTLGTTGEAIPARRDAAFGAMYEVESRGGERDLAISVTGIKRWRNGSIAQVGYQWSRSTDLMTRFNPTANLAFQNSPIDGTIDARRRARSGVDVPHSVVASLLGQLPYKTLGSLVFRAQSGRPYAYVVTRDANADGTASNDLIYVPRDSADISLSNPARYSALDQFIESRACLREQRGHVMSRNSCRNPAIVTLDARLAKILGERTGRGLEVGLDVFNLLNLLNHDWGLVREASGRELLELLPVAGWDAAANRPRYTVPDVLPARSLVAADVSRWRIQLTARYRIW